jgi:hypothetical protein
MYGIAGGPMARSLGGAEASSQVHRGVADTVVSEHVARRTRHVARRTSHGTLHVARDKQHVARCTSHAARDLITPPYLQPQSLAADWSRRPSPATLNCTTTGGALCGVNPKRIVRAPVNCCASAAPSGAKSAS